MAFSSEPLSSAPLSAESATNAAYAAASIAPLCKFGSHVGKVNILAPANAIAPLLKYGSHTGSIHWTPRDITCLTMPVYPLLKFGTPGQALPLVAVPIGPLFRFSKQTAILGKKTGSANHVGPLFKLGAPSASFVSNHAATHIGQLLKFASCIGQVGVVGQSASIGRLLKFGAPSGPYKRLGKSVRVLTTNNVVYVSRRKAA